MVKNPNAWLFTAILYTIFVVYISLVDADAHLPSEKWFEHQDKVFHFIIYSILAIIWGIYIHKIVSKRPLLISFALTFIFGILLESFQEKISPFRTYDFLDLVSNCIGVILGTIFVHYYIKYKVKIN